MKESQVRKGFQTVKGDFNTLVNDLTTVLQSLIDMGKTEVGEQKEVIARELEKKVRVLKGNVDQVYREGREKMETLEAKIQEHPMTSVIAAFGIGLLIGRLFDRRG